MTFEEAKQAVEQGKTVKRQDWQDRTLIIESIPATKNAYICKMEGNAKLLSWLSAQDINANDWIAL